MDEARWDPQELRLSFLELLAYLAASANGAVSSTKLYGPLRLMEAGERLIRLMDSLGMADGDLKSLADRIVAEGMAISTDADRCRAFTDEAAVMCARKLMEVSRASADF